MQHSHFSCLIGICSTHVNTHSILHNQFQKVGKKCSPNSWHPPITFFPIEISGNQPPVGNVIPVQTSLVKKDGVEVFVFLQVAIGRRKASSLRTASCVERIQMLTHNFAKKSSNLCRKALGQNPGHTPCFRRPRSKIGYTCWKQR